MSDTDKYEGRLGKMLAAITDELKTIGVLNPDNPADWVERSDTMNTTEADPNDVADRVEDYDERRATLAVLETRYNNIRRALKKIDTNTYGTCEICDGPVEEDRLETNPTARTDKAHIDQEANLTN